MPAIFLAFKETFVAGWAPAMIVFDYNVVKGYPKGMKACLRRGLRVYSTKGREFLSVRKSVEVKPCLLPEAI